MPGFLKQSTASQSRAIGPFLDDTDFKTAETGLTIANTDIKLVVNGGASANKNSGGGTHRVNGFYGVTFDATDTATVGEIEVSIVVAGALPVFDKFFVVEEAVYDMLFGASALGYIANAPVVLADGQAHGGTLGSSTATLALSRLSVVSQSANTNALTVTGNGTGHGAALTSGSGATGNGMTLLAASTNGHGLKSTGTGTGDGFELTAGASGADLDADQVGAITGSITGNLSGSVGSVTGAVGSVTGSVGSVTGAVGSVTGAVGSVTGAVGSVTGNVGGNVVGSVASVTAGVTLANNSMTAAASAADFLAEINAEVDTAIADVGLTTTITGRIDAAVSTRATPAQILTTALTEAYAADGAAGTLSQILFGLQAFLQERAVAGTTLTVKKLDGSTSAMTFTLSDPTSPVSVTRAT